MAAEAFNSNQFWQGFSAGPKISVTYHDESGYGAEFSYFNIFTQSATKTIGPTGPTNTADWLVMYAPGAFWQTQDFAYQGMAWKDATNLSGAEANGRLDLSPGVTVLGGLRWLQLNDTLVGWLIPADRIAPTWKGPCLLPGASGCALSDVPNPPPGGSVVIYPPFWTTSTRNDLYGAQIGVDAKLLELRRFSIDGVIKAGVFDNNAEQTTVVSMAKQLYTAQATTNAAAFVGEADLQVKYQLAKGLALKVGYEALWLDGVALAPGQIRETYTTSPSPASPSTPVSARALGVNCGSNVLFQGATAGLEYSF
ncbi:MAG: BBP7 family outer membrane beta-barrel protein [Roseiarcus sp.]